MASELANLPRHVAVIMDGNGRWARARQKPRHAGHRAGVRSVRSTVESAAKHGVECLTLFAFSSENWARPEDEVSSLMRLFLEALRREVDELHRNDVRLRIIGNREQLKPDLVATIAAAEEKTSHNKGLLLNVAVAYGGRWDILNATRQIAAMLANGEITVDQIDESMMSSRLQLAGCPEPDLLIRTGGEKRISNFLVWNLAYAELWFTDVLWPEFDAAQFELALKYFSRKQRRYGQTGDQVGVAGC